MDALVNSKSAIESKNDRIPEVVTIDISAVVGNYDLL